MHKSKGLIFLALLAVFSVATMIFLYVAVDNVVSEWGPLLDQRIRSRQQTNAIRILARDHNNQEQWLGSIVGGSLEVRKNLTLPEVNPLLLQAIVSLEDPRFLSHGGFDIIGIARATVKNIINLGYKEGASTLTQQLVKNLFLTQEKTLTRKFKEIILSTLVERRFQKEEILEAYLNEIFLGQAGYSDILGVQRATEFYFGKDQNDLDVSEIALIAAMVAGSGYYSPFKYPERTLLRRNKVLKILADGEKITPEEFREALSTPLPKEPHPSFRSKASYAIEEIRDLLIARDGEAKVALGGYDVEVTLDADLQRVSEEIFLNESKTWPKNLQAAIVGIDPRTCEFKVYQGGTSYAKTQYNRLTRATRPPGSLLKPIITSTLLDSDPTVTLATRVNDESFTWTYDSGRGKWTPKNYDRKFRGEVSVRTIIENSLNVPFAKLIEGKFPNGILTDLFAPLVPWGLNIPSNRALPSALLGSIEQRPIDVAKTYVSFVRTALGLHSFGEPACEPKFLPDESTTAQVGIYDTAAPNNHDGQVGTSLAIEAMQGVIRRGSAKILGSSLPTNQPWAGKTGTSSDKKDAWFVAASPSLVLLAWLGVDQNVETDYTGSWLSSHIVAPILKTYAQVLPAEGFNWPPNAKLSWKVIDLDRGCEYAGAYAREFKEKFEEIKAGGLPSEGMVDGHRLGYELFKDTDQISYCR